MPNPHPARTGHSATEGAALLPRLLALARRAAQLLRMLLADLYGHPDDWQAAVDAAAEGIAGRDKTARTRNEQGQ